MRLLFVSSLRYMKKHIIQTLFTILVTILVVGMLGVLFISASSFQNSLRKTAIEQKGTYHYKYYTYIDSATADILSKMRVKFGSDNFFSDVELVKDGEELSLILTVKNPGLLTSRVMNRKFNSLWEEFYIETGETTYIGEDHNWSLLASYGDLCKENGIYSFLAVFIVLMIIITIVSVLTIGSLSKVSAMQREYEIGLLSSVGAAPRQIEKMFIVESLFYCIVSLPIGYWLGIELYKKIELHIDNIIYVLFRMEPAFLTVSRTYSVGLIAVTAIIIILTGLSTAMKASKISTMTILHNLEQITINPKREKDIWNYEGINVSKWLAGKSVARFKKRYFPVIIIMTVTFVLCFVLNGIEEYSTKVMKMSYGSMSYDYSVDLYGNDREELEEIAEKAIEASCNRLVPIRERIFQMQEPYPLSEKGQDGLMTNEGMLPDVSVVCIEKKDFSKICDELLIAPQENEHWGIFINPEMTWWSNGTMISGKPYNLDVGDKITICGVENNTVDISIRGIYNNSLIYADNTQATRLQILVSDDEYSKLENIYPYKQFEPADYHIILRGVISGSIDVGEEIRTDADEKNIVYYINDYSKKLAQEKASIDSFKFLCRALIIMFVILCICGNFTISWTINKAREKEFAILSSVGMSSESVVKMRLWETIIIIKQALIPGMILGFLSYQSVYMVYNTEYQMSWQFPIKGGVLGATSLVVAIAFTEIAIFICNSGKDLAEQLKGER